MSAQDVALSSPRSSSLTVGLALFSMYFGAGNLIFPLLVGQAAGTNSWFAIAGLTLTAVAVPLLGLAAMLLFKGNLHQFLGRIGKSPAFLIMLLLQLIAGPLGVIPRLITLMHATVKPYLFNVSLPLFSIAMAAVIFLCTFRKQNLVHLLGAILTPFLVLLIAVLIIFGICSPSTSELVAPPPAWNSFFQGLLGGYNTMDLIASFLFATVLLPHFPKGTANPQKKMVTSILIAGSLLFLTYVGLCLIASTHANGLHSSSEELLGAIAYKLLGPIGGGIAAVAILLACLTTAITLASIFSDYLKKDICKERISTSTSLLLTLGITLCMANIGFGGIASFLGPILQVIYPGLIILSLLNLLHALYGVKIVKTPVFLAFAVSLLIFLF